MDGRLGNQCLGLYKLFLLAKLHSIPFTQIRLPKSKFCPLFQNIQDNFTEDSSILQSQTFQTYSSLPRSSFSSVDTSRNVCLSHFSWTYPATPEELRLFNYICCPKALKEEVIQKNSHLFTTPNVVGFCVRRGDFITIHDTISSTQVRVLSDVQIREIIEDISKKFCNDVKILITSDDIGYMREHFSSMPNTLFHENTTPHEDVLLLSLCNHIINNGAWYINDRVDATRSYESTFGQVSQCLKKSYAFV